MTTKTKILHSCIKDKEFQEIALNNQSVMRDIQEIKSSQERLEKSLEEMKQHNEMYGTKRDEKIDNFIKEMRENLSTHFAGKWVEKVMIGIGSIAGTIIVTALIYLVIQK